MKKLIIYALIGTIGWNYYNKNVAPKLTEAQVESQTLQSATPAAILPATNFSCDGREYCSQMSSRSEAEYFLNHCPNTKMDGDNDGVPCENDSRF